MYEIELEILSLFKENKELNIASIINSLGLEKKYIIPILNSMVDRMIIGKKIINGKVVYCLDSNNKVSNKVVDSMNIMTKILNSSLKE